MFNKLKEFLSIPQLYNVYQRLVVKKEFIKYYINDILVVNPNNKILDIGCGCGNMIPFLPKEIDYTGYDLSNVYIKYARKKFPQECYKFFVSNINDIKPELDKYDIIISNGVIISLDDVNADYMFKLASSSLKKNGKFVIYDGHYNDELPFWEKFFVTNERGKNLRTKEQYFLLGSKYFKYVDIILKNDAFNISYPMVIMKCTY